MAVKQTVPSNTNQTKSLTFSKLRGVDYSSSPFEVSTSRAVHMKNMINEDGVNHKRPGWTSNLPINKNWNERKIYDICEFAGKYIVAATSESTSIGLYVWDGVSSLDSATRITGNWGDAEYQDVPDKLFVPLDSKKILVVGMSYNPSILIYNEQSDTFSLESNQFYIPTTSISINSTDDEISGSVAYENPNMFTTKRKNSLIGKNIDTVKVTFKYEGTGDIYIGSIDMNGMFSAANISNFSNHINYSLNAVTGTPVKEISFRVVPGVYQITAALNDYDGYDQLYAEDGALIGEESGSQTNCRQVSIEVDTTIYIREG